MVDLNFRRLADYIWYFRKDNLLMFKVSRLNVFQCGGWVSDLLWEDGVTWETVDDLMDSQVYKWLWNHNTDILDSILKIRNPWRKLWDEKYITQHICGLFGDYYNITYEDFINKVQTERRHEYAVSLYNEDWIPLLWIGDKIVDNYWNTLDLLSTSL